MEMGVDWRRRREGEEVEERRVEEGERSKVGGERGRERWEEGR